MNPAEIRAFRARLRLTIRDGAFVAGVETRTWERWEQGVRAIPAPVERLLWAVERDPTLMDHLREMALYSAL
jgi:DNA-binding transcriptional regulator YiaG